MKIHIIEKLHICRHVRGSEKVDRTCFIEVSSVPDFIDICIPDNLNEPNKGRYSDQ